MTDKKSAGGGPCPAHQDLKVRGFSASGVSCGIKRGGRPDLALIISDTEAIVAGVFTTSAVKAASLTQ